MICVAYQNDRHKQSGHLQSKENSITLQHYIIKLKTIKYDSTATSSKKHGIHASYNFQAEQSFLSA